MNKINLEIDGKKIEIDEGKTILEAANELQIKIPTLCSHKALIPYGACRLCLVQIEQNQRPPEIVASCTYPVTEGLVVKTDIEKVTKTRKIMAELLLARCPDSEVIRDIAKEIGVGKSRIAPKNKDCILCGLCVRMCQERMGRGAINFVGRGSKKEVKSAFGKPSDVCQTCGACDFICPTQKIILPEVSKTKAVPIPFEFNMGLISRSPVYLSYPQAVPNVPTIDGKTCVHFLTGECSVCKEVCEAGAIDFEQKEEKIDIKAGAIILTPGVELFDANIKKEYGYDRYDNVITSLQFERILSSSGPTKAEVLRPSDGKHPRKIAFIQCVGSRDSYCGNEFCSSVCCMYSIKQSVIAKEHDSQIEPTIFFIDIRTFGKDFERYYEKAKEEAGVNFVRCMISKIYEKAKSKNLIVKYIDSTNKCREDEFDLIVLAVGLTDASGLKPLAKKLGIEINEDEFVRGDKCNPTATSKEGIYVAGTYAEPKDIPETVTDGSAAACLVSELLKDVRGTLIQKKEYPPQRDIEDEDIRIGVFVCRCGRNIASIVNVPEVVKYASTLKDVVYSGEFLYSCSKDSLDVIKEKIAQHDLNRVIVASCTPRTHEELFRDTVREAGLNKYLFEMASLREQVSWVHKDFPKEATQKSKELVDMMVAKIRLTKPLHIQFSDVVHKALVIGGGASGMRAALGIAGQGYEVYLVEKENELGGNLRHLYDNLDGEDPQKFLATLIERVNSCESIKVLIAAKLANISGYTGNYTSIVEGKGKSQEINYGIVVVASGGDAYEPKKGEFGYGDSSKIITQVSLEEMLAKDKKKVLDAKTFVMIQCVGSRNDEHPYCSRICCTHAVKNAIKLKKLNPDHRIIILYRDIRTYGFFEKYYLQAREAGVLFLRYDVDKQPEVKAGNAGISVKHFDEQLRDVVNFEPDYLVLSIGIVAAGNEELTKTLKLPVTADGFYMEAHAKIRPLDFITEGMFFCGLAHSPRLLHESLTQAQGAAVRAVTIISKEKIEAKAITAMVNEKLCKGCGLCVSVCPFDARKLNEETGVAEVIDILCQGCGACAVVCLSDATIHKGFTRKQILNMISKSI